MFAAQLLLLRCSPELQYMEMGPSSLLVEVSMTRRR
jgi:hypothetical protein